MKRRKSTLTRAELRKAAKQVFDEESTTLISEPEWVRKIINVIESDGVNLSKPAKQVVREYVKALFDFSERISTGMGNN